MGKTIFILALVTFLSVQVFADCPSGDFNGDCKVDFQDFSMFASEWLDKEVDDLGVFASQWLDIGFSYPNITWVYIYERNVPEENSFIGYMSKYETTNAQYCLFLNSALASGDIRIEGGSVFGNSGPYEGQCYYSTSSPYAQIFYSNGFFYVNNSDGTDMGNHPVVLVTWYGAAGFANYYGWKLPTKLQWQAVADYDGSYIYGCGTTIDHSKANYDRINPLGLSYYPLTTPVGYYPSYGYGLCDMAGNVAEWVRFNICGGQWWTNDWGCAVQRSVSSCLDFPSNDTGFRVCFLDEIIIPDLIGVDQVEAESAIIDSGLIIDYISYAYSDSMAEGTVISLNPPPGDTVLLGASVSFMVSLGPAPVPDMTWIHIDNDPGIGGDYEGFDGYMSKYETTNDQYCLFLNAALSSGDITVQSNGVYGNSGIYSGQIYYDIDADDAQIYYSNGMFNVKTHDGHDMGNHPVVEVSWYGAAAFANYYGWQLPTKFQWRAVADYDGSFIYSCGATIDHSKANYDNDNPLGFSSSPHTSPVGYYPAYGYGLCDISGNVWEFVAGGDACGGAWDFSEYFCDVSKCIGIVKAGSTGSRGFRVCRSID